MNAEIDKHALFCDQSALLPACASRSALICGTLAKHQTLKIFKTISTAFFTRNLVMICLNLLSQSKKEELKFKKLHILLKDFLLIILIFAILIAIILEGANAILVNIFNDTIFSTSLVNTDYKLFKTDIEKMNRLLANVKETQKNYIYYDDLLLEITNLIPKDITLSNLSINIENKKATFKGRAKTRDGFLEFQKNLEASAIFNNIQAPISNMLKKENIDFFIEADLMLENMDITL